MADPEKILFITGDRKVWGIADYADLRALIDYKEVVTDPSDPNLFDTYLAFKIGIDGDVSSTYGNVLSRANSPWPTSPNPLLPPAEDPWISISGGHLDGVRDGLIVWGEGDFEGPYQALKEEHYGIDVYVAAFIEATDKDQCKKGAFADVRRFDGNTFKNQGDCVSYVASQGRSDARGNRGN